MVLIGIGVFVAVFAALVAVAYKGDDYAEECKTDIPCQECGRCYNSHPSGAFSNHSYVYPRGIHR